MLLRGAPIYKYIGFHKHAPIYTVTTGLHVPTHVFSVTACAHVFSHHSADSFCKILANAGKKSVSGLLLHRVPITQGKELLREFSTEPSKLTISSQKWALCSNCEVIQRKKDKNSGGIMTSITPRTTCGRRFA